MERRAPHVYALPSASRSRLRQDFQKAEHRNASSAPAASVSSSVKSQTPSRSISLKRKQGAYQPEDWSIISFARKLPSAASSSPSSTSGETSPKSPLSMDGPILFVNLLHHPTGTLYSWPMFLNPTAPQPQQGTCFVTPFFSRPRRESEPVKAEKKNVCYFSYARPSAPNIQTYQQRYMPHSLALLMDIMTVWMRTSGFRERFRSKESIKQSNGARRKLGENEMDREWISEVLDLTQVSDDQQWRTPKGLPLPVTENPVPRQLVGE